MTHIRKYSVFLVCAVLAACSGDGAGEKDSEDVANVTTAEARVLPLALGPQFAGTVESNHRARLATKVMGWVEEMPFNEGAAVKAGDILVKLRNNDIVARHAQAEATLAKARAHLDNAATNLKRIASLHARKAATDKELDDIRTAHAASTAGATAAEGMKREAEEMLAYATIRAPFDGVITGKSVQVGDLAAPGRTLLQIEDLTDLKVVAKVPESSVKSMTAGMPAQVSFATKNGGNDRTLATSLDRVVPAGDPRSRQFDVHLFLNNNGDEIKPGMFARVSVAGAESLTLQVPRLALFRRGQLQGLFVVDTLASRAWLRWVTTGLQDGGMVEILAGLSPGETVVVRSETKLSDGQAVRTMQ